MGENECRSMKWATYVVTGCDRARENEQFGTGRGDSIRLKLNK